MRLMANWVARHLRGEGTLPFSFQYGGRPSAAVLGEWRRERDAPRQEGGIRRWTLNYWDPGSGLHVRCEVATYGEFPVVEWVLYFHHEGAADSPILSEIQALDLHLCPGELVPGLPAAAPRRPEAGRGALDPVPAGSDGGLRGMDVGQAGVGPGRSAADLRQEAPPRWLLHHHAGSPCTPYDYEPRLTPLGAGADVRITTSGGRSSNSDFPYFNLEWSGDREQGSAGVIVVVGWPGQWAARFTCCDAAQGAGCATADPASGGLGSGAGAGHRSSAADQAGTRGDHLVVQAGMEHTHFRLHPGEEVRTPRILLQFWTGDRADAQNTFRRWMLAYNLPPGPGGTALAPVLTPCSSHQFDEMVRADEASQILFIDRYLEEGLRPDYWWMDAGWYPNAGTWTNTGTWEVDERRFPRGLRAVTDHGHAHGVGSILWFEPERVMPGTRLYVEHPEWLLGPDGGTKLLHLANDDARRWLTDHVHQLLREQGIDVYRHDFNMDPLPYWRAADAPDRQGIAEIGHVTGLLAYWDELRRRNPGLIIDTCASGGRRNDLESLRRAVPLLRSDYIFEPVGQQCHTYGLSFWVPFYGTGTRDVSPYAFRSTMCPCIIPCWDVRRPDLDYELLRRLVGQWRAVAPYYAGDYYPLTPYSRADNVWLAWQFHRPDLDRGVVHAFRRASCDSPSCRLCLRGLRPDALYELQDMDAEAAAARRLSGAELAQGMEVHLPQAPSAAVLCYRRLEAGDTAPLRPTAALLPAPTAALTFRPVIA